MLEPPVDDMCLFHTATQCLEAAFDFREHPSLDNTRVNHVLGVLIGHRLNQVFVIIQHPLHIGQKQELFRPEGGGDLAGHDIGVDIVGFSVFSQSCGGDDGNESALCQRHDQVGVDLFHFSDQTKINDFRRSVFGFPIVEVILFRHHQIAVFAA